LVARKWREFVRASVQQAKLVGLARLSDAGKMERPRAAMWLELRSKWPPYDNLNGERDVHERGRFASVNRQMRRRLRFKSQYAPLLLMFKASSRSTSVLGRFPFEDGNTGGAVSGVAASGTFSLSISSSSS